LEGHVVSETGAPVAHAELLARGSRADEVRGQSSDSGAFSLEVGPDVWSLSARAGNEAGALPPPIAIAAGATPAGLDVRLGKAAPIFGAVVRQRDHEPIAGAEVLISPHNADGDSARAVTDSSGAYEAGGLAPGAYDAVVVKEGFGGEEKRGIALTAGARFE